MLKAQILKYKNKAKALKVKKRALKLKNQELIKEIK